jgi:hypothetical protein
MHLECLRLVADRKCYDCKTEFPIKDLYNLKRTLNQANIDQPSPHIEELEPLSKRRKLEDESEPK